MVVSGASNEVIAFRLGISEQTAKAHVTHLLRSFGAANRAELAARAVSLGLVPAGASDRTAQSGDERA